MKIVAFFKLIRIQNLLIIAFTQYMVRWCLIYPILKVQSSYFTLQLSELQFFLLVLSTVMITAAGYIINDYFDVRIDKVNKPERLVIDKGVKRRVAMGAHMIINILAVLIGVYVSYTVGSVKLAFIHFICVSGLWFYSTTFKKQFLIGNVIIAVFTALVPFVVVLYELLLCYKAYLPLDETLSFKSIWIYISGISFFTFIITLLHEIIKYIQGYEGDKEYGYNTMPVVLGKRTTKFIAVLIVIVILAFLAYYQFQQLEKKDFLTFYYFVFCLQLPLIYLGYKLLIADTKKAFQLAGNITKIVMLMGICYLFVFAYILLHFIKLI
ncbi:MAG: geranylgeranylglycerol-phosphate geranylgeranyltransferase [Bacteroidota bacterium]